MNDILKSCTLCPKESKVTAKVRIARAELHMWEEPCISGTEGSGTVFFSGCCLKCCFCQNYEISAEGKGFMLTEQELADADDYVKNHMSFILHGDLIHYRTLKRLKNKHVAQQLSKKNRPYFINEESHFVSQYRMS